MENLESIMNSPGIIELEVIAGVSIIYLSYVAHFLHKEKTKKYKQLEFDFKKNFKFKYRPL